MNSKPVLIVAALATLACAEKPAAETAPAAGTKLGETAGMKTPESAKYDAELDVYFVSNVNGNPSVKDNNGFIARVRADSTSVMTMLVEGGKNGVTLNAPKGIAIKGDTLYVTDIDALRLFNKKTGASLGEIELKLIKATFLNDVTVGPDGVYFTDTGIKFDDKGAVTHPGTNMIVRFDGMRATVVASGDSLMSPNGITWIAPGSGQPGKFLIAPFGSPNVLTWMTGQKVPTALTSGPGGYDGIEALANGNVLVSSWTDSTVWIAHGGTHMVKLIQNVSAPADIGVDTKRNVLAIPRFNDGKVEYYQLP